MAIPVRRVAATLRRMADQSDSTPQNPGVQLQLRPFPTALLSFWFSPRFSVDGMEPMKMGWGKGFVPLSPGNHTLSCWLGNYRRDNIDVVVPRNGVLSARWRGPVLAGMAGKWTILD